MARLLSRLGNWLLGTARKGTRRGSRPTSTARRRLAHRPLGQGFIEQLEERAQMAVTYHGGALLTNVEAQAVYLGSDWASNSTLTNQKASLDQFLTYVVNSPYMDMLTNAGYNVSRGSASAGQTLNLSLNKSSGVTDTQIQSYLQSAIKSGQLATPDANRLYVVYVEPGASVKMGGDSSVNSFLGYHGAFSGTSASGQRVDIRYAVMPYPGSPNPSTSSQGFSSAVDELTAVTSHELSEAVTNPDVNYKRMGWYDDRLNGEIADFTTQTTRLNGYLVQDVYDKNDHLIAPNPNSTGGTTGGTTGGSTGGTTGGTTGGGTTTVTAPTNLAATALSATSVALSWTAASGASGYRIFLDVDGKSTLLGTVGASRTSVTVTGLTAGTAPTFHVQAFRGSAIADSDIVTVTLPSAAVLTAPQVTATAASSTSAQLNWTAVSGASGYRIYLRSGNRVVYLGSVSSGTTSVRVVGLAAGSTSQLLVEAYSPTSQADSAWVSVTMPSRFRTSLA